MSNKELLQSNNELLQAIRDVLGNGTTYEEIINQIGKEDEFDKGCYYRVVDGEKEWINPPLLNGTVYRTTERFDEKPVYRMCIIETIPGNSNMSTGYLRNLPKLTLCDVTGMYTVTHSGAERFLDFDAIYLDCLSDTYGQQLMIGNKTDYELEIKLNFKLYANS